MEILQELYKVLREVDKPSAEFEEILSYIAMGIITPEQAGDMVAREYSDSEILAEIESLMEALR